MKWLVPALMLAGLALPVSANDTMATLGAGGLVFIQTGDVQMLSENLYLSPTAVRVTYTFRNNGPRDAETLVAFPLPDITGDGDFMEAVPSEDSTNVFGFTTTLEGKPVGTQLHQYAFATGVDYTAYLDRLGIPLLPYGHATQAALNALGADTQNHLMHLGLVIPMTYDAGQGEQTDYVPVWTLKSTYTWVAHFPAGKTVTVSHRYTPSVGGTAGVMFLGPSGKDYDPAAAYAKKYCTDKSFIDAVKKTLPDPYNPYGAPFTEKWLSYVWSTGANWSGPVGKFHLTIDKGAAENLVSFCWPGKVTKTSPTTFEMDASDWYPPWDHELEVLILDRREEAN